MDCIGQYCSFWVEYAQKCFEKRIFARVICNCKTGNCIDVIIFPVFVYDTGRTAVFSYCTVPVCRYLCGLVLFDKMFVKIIFEKNQRCMEPAGASDRNNERSGGWNPGELRENGI